MKPNLLTHYAYKLKDTHKPSFSQHPPHFVPDSNMTTTHPYISTYHKLTPVSTSRMTYSTPKQPTSPHTHQTRYKILPQRYVTNYTNPTTKHPLQPPSQSSNMAPPLHHSTISTRQTWQESTDQKFSKTPTPPSRPIFHPIKNPSEISTRPKIP